MDKPKFVLIQYVGDHIVAKNFAHGNAKYTDMPHVTTNKSVRDDTIKELFGKILRCILEKYIEIM